MTHRRGTSAHTNAHARTRTHTDTYTHRYTHTAGRGLSAITAQWNIFRLERCRITLQPDDKYAVSTIINLAPLPIFRLQTWWCKRKGGQEHAGWSLCLSCGCGRAAGACSEQRHCLVRWALTSTKRSWHSDSTGSLVMSLFRKAGGCVQPRSHRFFIQALSQRKIHKIPPHLLYTLSLLFSSCPCTHCRFLFLFCCHPSFFHPRGFPDILPWVALCRKWPLSG